MSQKFLLVDFENIQQVDLSKFDTAYKIIIFIGINQKSIATSLVMKNQHLGSRLEWKQVDGNGKNALDFYIAYELGKIFVKDPQTECVILSKDTGFKPLVDSLAKEGRLCRRIESLHELKKPATEKTTPPK
jgi:uncharacterized LabA/DUF88 family protein